jgi:phosphatidylglycerol---prolipoprotein diacylglyceryl transferase
MCRGCNSSNCEGLLLLIALGLLISNDALKWLGLVIEAFAVGYSLMRCFCGLFREPDSQVGFLWDGVTMGMLLSLPLLLAGLSLIWNAFRCPRTRAV